MSHASRILERKTKVKISRNLNLKKKTHTHTAIARVDFSHRDAPFVLDLSFSLAHLILEKSWPERGLRV